jgi:hypothetical protein
MNLHEILTRLDLERQTVPDADIVLERTQSVVRAIAKLGNRNAIVYSNFSAQEAERIIESEIDYFTKLRQSFEWKVYSHDEPADLLERLRQRGFTIGTEEALMVLDLREMPAVLLAPLPADVTVRPVGDEREIEYFLQLETEIWGESLTTREFLRFNQSDPLRRDVAFVAYVNEKPVGMARVTASSQSQFAGLWGGSVLDQFRGRGVSGLSCRPGSAGPTNSTQPATSELTLFRPADQFWKGTDSVELDRPGRPSGCRVKR